MATFGRQVHVAVYFPQSYNFAGNLLVFPKDQVQALDAESSEVMAFIVSGGVSGGTSNGTEDEDHVLTAPAALPPPHDSQDSA